jgi:CRP/FNR family transcriptional regulator, anaerobic regulatory protein
MTPAAAAATRFGAFRPSSLRPCAHPDPSACAAVDPADRAFEARRRAVVSAGDLAPLERVAAFLVSISRNNRHEGRDPTVIPDTLTCGFVTDLLGIPIDTLAAILKTLEKRGLIATDPRCGLRLKDLDGLEGLAGP